MAAADLVLRRRISLRAFAGLYAVLGVLAVVIWVVGFRFATELRAPPAVIVAAGLIPLLAGAVYTWVVRLSTEYRVFQDSLEVESGILARRIDNIQLFRVRDIGLFQSITGRLLGVGNVTVTSTDHSNPRFVLRGVDDPRGLYQTLRELVARSQATRRTMIVEEDATPLDGPGR